MEVETIDALIDEQFPKQWNYLEHVSPLFSSWIPLGKLLLPGKIKV
jgi:uncharacterized Tic20 family protein